MNTQAKLTRACKGAGLATGAISIMLTKGAINKRKLAEAISELKAAAAALEGIDIA